MAGNRAKRSAVWSHLTRKADGSLESLPIVLPGKGGDTSNLIKHLRINHKIDINTCTTFKVKKPKADLDSDPYKWKLETRMFQTKKVRTRSFHFYLTITLSIRH